MHQVIACQTHPEEPNIYGSIACCETPNAFSCILLPGPNPVAVKAGGSTQFILSFVYASDKNGYGAFTTPQAAQTISVEQGENASQWTITPNISRQNPTWTLTPPEGSPIIGTGTHAFVEFKIGKITTQFQPGPTIMYMQYRNVPGYNDGAYAILLYKEQAKPDIKSFTISPKSYAAYRDPYLGNVFFKYEAYGAQAFELNIEHIGKGPVPGYPQILPCDPNGQQAMDPNLPPGQYIATLSPISPARLKRKLNSNP